VRTVGIKHKEPKHNFYVIRTVHILIINTLTQLIIVSPNGSTAPWGPRPPHFSTLHDHTLLDTPHSVGLLWTNDQLVAETST
jgi:hypothetical protein